MGGKDGGAMSLDDLDDVYVPRKRRRVKTKVITRCASCARVQMGIVAAIAFFLAGILAFIMGGL